MDDGRRPSLTTLLFLLALGGGFLAFDLWTRSAGADPQDETPAAEAAAAPPEDEGPPGAEEDVAGGDARTDPTAGGDSERGPGAAEEEAATLVGDGFEVEVTNANGALRSVRLLDEKFESRDGDPYDVVRTDKDRFLPFQIELAGVDIPAGPVWELTQPSDDRVVLRWAGDGVEVTRTLRPGDGPYQLRSTVTVKNTGSRDRRTRLRVKTYHYVDRDEEKGGGFFGIGGPGPGQAHAICLWKGDEVVRHDREADEITVVGNDFAAGMGWGPEVRWTGVENRYFANLLVAPDGRVERCRMAASDRGNPDPVGTLFQAQLSHDEMQVPAGGQVDVETVGYFGPKDPKALSAAGHQLDRVVDLGFFAAIAGVLADLLAFIHGLVGSWGLAIILLTVLIRTLLFPLTLQSFRSMARMRLLKPEMDRINELYKDDAEKKGAAIMELYRKNKVNPVSGCLPQLLQLPVWWALYTSLSTNFELYHAPFLIWEDLSASDPYFILPLSVGALIFFQQKLTPAAMDPAQAKVMLYVMPAMITSFMLFLPAGLCVYIATNSVLGIAQQKWIERGLEKQKQQEVADGSDTGTDGAPGQKTRRAHGGNGHADPTDATAGPASSTGSSSSTVRTRKPDRRRKRRGRA